MLMWRTVTLLWPFLKELFLGKKTLGEALKTNKGRVFLIFAIVGSFAMNVWLIPNVIRISADYVELKHRYDAAHTDPIPIMKPSPAPSSADTKTDHVMNALPAQVRSPDTPASVPDTSLKQWNDYDHTLRLFDQIEVREHSKR